MGECSPFRLNFGSFFLKKFLSIVSDEWSSPNYAGYSRPRTFPYHHILVLPWRTRHHPRFAYSLLPSPQPFYHHRCHPFYLHEIDLAGGQCVGRTVYDVSNRESFDALPRWFSELETYVSSSVVKIIVGNKVDKVRISTSFHLHLPSYHVHHPSSCKSSSPPPLDFSIYKEWALTIATGILPSSPNLRSRTICSSSKLSLRRSLRKNLRRRTRRVPERGRADPRHTRAVE